MPMADLLEGLFRSRGATEVMNIFKRATAPAGTVMRDAGPMSGRIANELAGVEDDMAAGTSNLLNSYLPLDAWEKIKPEKRIEATFAHEGLLNPVDMQRAMADPEIAGMVKNMAGFFGETDAQNLAATDHLGNPLNVRNPWTGEKEAYQSRGPNYFPHMVKRSKRDSILEPMAYAQADIEKTLTRQYLDSQGLGYDVSLDPVTHGTIKAQAADAIHEYFRTGTPNQLVKDKRLINVLDPALKNFKEITDHLRSLQLAKAGSRGQPTPAAMDPILALFGSPDPKDQRSGIRMFQEFLLRDAQNARRFGSIESSRAMPLPRDWYERDPLKVAPLYAIRQQRRLAEIRRFGQDNELVLGDDGWLSKIPDERDREFAKKIFDRHMGLEPWNKSLAMSKLMDGIFATQVIKLGTAQISQLGQIMNVIMETGLGPTWDALSNLGKSRDVALKSGAALTRVMDIVREGLADPLEESGARKFTEGFLKWTGFNRADLIARHIGAGAGYAHGQEILRRIVTNPGDIKALKEIRRLMPGMNANPKAFEPVLAKITAARNQLGTRPTLDQIEKFFQDELYGIARTASLNANFRQSILDVPGWATTPLGRTVSMFRTFAYKQTLFVKNRVIEDLKNGNPRPIIGLAAGAGVLGPLVGVLKSIPQGRFGEVQSEYAEAANDPTKAAWKAAENIATVGALGLFDQTMRAMRRGELGWWEFMGGPLFSDIANGFGGTGKAVAGSVLGDETMRDSGINQVGRFVGGKIPVVGGGVGRAVKSLSEDVTRYPSGLVTRGLKQPLGTESPPTELFGYTLPSPRVLFGLEQSATARREKHLEEIKAAIDAGDMVKMREAISAAVKDGVVITGTSIKRLIRNKALEDAGIVQ